MENLRALTCMQAGLTISGTIMMPSAECAVWCVASRCLAMCLLARTAQAMIY
eukprot:COSAG01_NODE_27219_length_691_cov_0.913851_2_plen_52_part_00